MKICRGGIISMLVGLALACDGPAEDPDRTSEPQTGGAVVRPHEVLATIGTDVYVREPMITGARERVTIVRSLNPEVDVLTGAESMAHLTFTISEIEPDTSGADPDLIVCFQNVEPLYRREGEAPIEILESRTATMYPDDGQTLLSVWPHTRVSCQHPESGPLSRTQLIDVGLIRLQGTIFRVAMVGTDWVRLGLYRGSATLELAESVLDDTQAIGVSEGCELELDRSETRVATMRQLDWDDVDSLVIREILGVDLDIPECPDAGRNYF